MFKHNICGDQPEVPNGMPDSANPLPPEFFVSPRCSLVSTSSEVATTEVHHREVVEDPERSAPVGGLNGTPQVLLFFHYFYFIFYFCNGPSMAA